MMLPRFSSPERRAYHEISVRGFLGKELPEGDDDGPQRHRHDAAVEGEPREFLHLVITQDMDGASPPGTLPEFIRHFFSAEDGLYPEVRVQEASHQEPPLGDEDPLALQCPVADIRIEGDVADGVHGVILHADNITELPVIKPEFQADSAWAPGTC